MPDAVDVYADQFQVNISAWGATLNFSLSPFQVPSPGTPVLAERVATVRTSLEHLKVLTFILRRQLQQFERDGQSVINLPTGLLAALNIAREDWDTFWR